MREQSGEGMQPIRKRHIARAVARVVAEASSRSEWAAICYCRSMSLLYVCVGGGSDMPWRRRSCCTDVVVVGDIRSTYIGGHT